jgi:L-fucose isomerase-like protein
VKAHTGYAVVSSGFLPRDELSAILGEYAPALESAGVPRLDPEALAPVDRLVIFVVTGGTEQRVLELVHAGGLSAASGSVVLVAYSGRNSLPAALEVLARLQQDGVDGSIVFLRGADDAEGIERLRTAVSAATAESAVSAAPATSAMPAAPTASALRAGARGAGAEAHASKPPGRPLSGKRIGLVGEPSDWLVASSPSPEVVREAWGAEVVEIGMAELENRINLGQPVSAEFFAEAYAERASRVAEPHEDDLVASGAVYVALRALVDEMELDAITVRCFDLVIDREATGCLALSRLADQGVVAGCEGDLPSTIAMLWVRERLGATSWMANPARVDVDSNALTLAHCTVPCSMVDAFELRSHFESGLGAAVQGSIPIGPATLLRIGGRGLDRMWTVEGEITASGSNAMMCRTQVEVALRGAGAGGVRVGDGTVVDLLERPLGNHIVLTRGWVSDKLLEQTSSE